MVDPFLFQVEEPPTTIEAVPPILIGEPATLVAPRPPAKPHPKPKPKPPVHHQQWSLDWDSVAFCESSGRWHIATGNGFYGGLQFTQSTWNEFDGDDFAPRADLATPYQQKVIAERTLKVQGRHAWPVCGARGGPQDERFSRLVVRWVNYIRVHHGERPLRFTSIANRWADAWSKHIVKRFEHSSMQAFLRFSGARGVGEVMVDGDVTPRQVAYLWLHSPPHRAVMLNRAYTNQGVGAQLYQNSWHVVMNVLYR